MASKNHPGAFDCHANADGDEPMFVLLARDELAPNLVRVWAFARMNDWEGALAALSFVAMEAKKKSAPQSEKMVEALVCADAMEQYLNGLQWSAELDAARTYKVFDVDNLGRDYQTEYLIEGTEGLSKEQAEQVAKWLNKDNGEFSSRYCTVVHNERKPYVFEGY